MSQIRIAVLSVLFEMKTVFFCFVFPRNDTIDAYLDDTPILEYARTTMDAKCTLRLVGEGFGEDGYGIGLPKGSLFKVSNSSHSQHSV